MRQREIKWLIAIVFIGVLSGMTIKSWQYWQRNHFQCSGEMRLLNSGYQGDISLRFVFDSTRGLVIVRGEITPPQGESFTINQNIWFSFTATASTTSCDRKPSLPASAKPSRRSILTTSCPSFSCSRRCRFTLIFSGSINEPGCCIPAGRRLCFAKPDQRSSGQSGGSRQRSAAGKSSMRKVLPVSGSPSRLNVIS